MPSVFAKALSRLSRDRLIELCLSWSKSSKCSPYLASNRNIRETEEEDYLHEPAQSRHELKTIYSAFGHDSSGLGGLSKRDIVDRIVDGDWRRGLSYEQLAQIDFANLEENDTTLRWSALRLVPLTEDEEDCGRQRAAKRRRIDYSASTVKLPGYPESSPSTFVQNLKSHISPLVKAHCHIHRVHALSLCVVRLHIVPNTPFAPLSSNVPRQEKAATDAARIMYIALPDSCPFVYISISGSAGMGIQQGKNPSSTATKVDIGAAKRIILEAIPKALSRPQQRWSLQSTDITAKSLRAVSLLRGSGKIGASGGILSTLMRSTTETALLDQPEGEIHRGITTHLGTLGRHQKQVEQRFGRANGARHARLDRVQFKILDLTEGSRSKRRKRNHDLTAMSAKDPTPMTITLSGPDVFAGLKQFALDHPNYIDFDKMPPGFTGEAGTSSIKI